MGMPDDQQAEVSAAPEETGGSPEPLKSPLMRRKPKERAARSPRSRRKKRRRRRRKKA